MTSKAGRTKMKISIEYCTVWNYDPKAVSLADAVKNKFGIKPELIPSDGGAFEVSVDGDKIFSKLKTGRFPEHDEIFMAIEKVKTWNR